jgi:hypothetical protein
MNSSQYIINLLNLSLLLIGFDVMLLKNISDFCSNDEYTDSTMLLFKRELAKLKPIETPKGVEKQLLILNKEWKIFNC